LRTPADLLEIGALIGIDLERGAALAFPASRFKRQKALQPAFDIRPVINREAEFTQLGKSVPKAVELLALLLADMGSEIFLFREIRRNKGPLVTIRFSNEPRLPGRHFFKRRLERTSRVKHGKFDGSHAAHIGKREEVPQRVALMARAQQRRADIGMDVIPDAPDRQRQAEETE